MYTPQDLSEHAGSCGLRVSTRQIEEWNKAGFLPKPERRKIPGQGRGRAPYQYPDPAKDAVVWLGMHRRSIEGANTVRFWMWVEGFQYIDVDVNTFLRDRVASDWEGIRVGIPSLPDIDQVAGMTWEQRERILDEIDANITTPLLQSGALSAQRLPEVTIGAATLGILPAERLTGTPALTGADDDGEHKPYPDSLIDEETWEKLRTVMPYREDHEILALSRELVPQMTHVGNFVEVYRLASQGGFDSHRLRSVWALQKRLVGDEELIKRYEYDPFLAGTQYLLMERTFRPWLFSFLPDLLDTFEMLTEDPEMPPELATKLKWRVEATRKALSLE